VGNWRWEMPEGGLLETDLVIPEGGLHTVGNWRWWDSHGRVSCCPRDSWSRRSLSTRRRRRCWYPRRYQAWHPPCAAPVKKSTGHTRTHTAAEQTTHTNTERATAQRRLIVKVITSMHTLQPPLPLVPRGVCFHRYDDRRPTI